MTAFIAIDWGTTNRRVYAIDAAGTVTHSERDDRGVIAMRDHDYAAEVAAIRARFDGAPVLCAGMVGANIGWMPAPYVAAPAGFEALAAGLVRPVDGVAIVPGVRTAAGDRADVMRGEEVQLLGAVAAGLTPADALLCQPGTHCKWAWMEEGRIAGFTTAMTGEVFSLVGRHSLLAAQIGDGRAVPGDAFRAGVQEGARRDLLASLFGIRAQGLLGELADADAASFTSGVAIGADCAARVGAGDDVYLLADPVLGALYRVAVAELGATPHLIDSHAAFLAGITRIWSLVS